MYVVNLSRADRLANKQQQVKYDVYVAPRRNKGFSTLFHASPRNVFFFNQTEIGILENPPQAAIPYDAVPSGTTDPIYWDGTSSGGNLLNRYVVTNVAPTNASITVNDDVLSISNEQVVHNVEVTKESIPIVVIDNNGN